MALKAVKVSTKALDQIYDITAATPESQQKITDAINTAIDDLWIKVCKGEVNLLLTDNDEFLVRPKPEFSRDAQNKLGKKGPYTVIQTCKSWVGISDGIYKIKDCDCFVPVTWFSRIEPVEPKETKSTNNLFTIILAITSLLQSGAILAFFLL